MSILPLPPFPLNTITYPEMVYEAIQGGLWKDVRARWMGLRLRPRAGEAAQSLPQSSPSRGRPSDMALHDLLLRCAHILERTVPEAQVQGSHHTPFPLRDTLSAGLEKTLHSSGHTRGNQWEPQRTRKTKHTKTTWQRLKIKLPLEPQSTETLQDSHAKPKQGVCLLTYKI